MRRRLRATWRRLRSWYGYGPREALFCYCGKPWPSNWATHGHVPSACSPGGCSPERCAYARVTGVTRDPAADYCHAGAKCIVCRRPWAWNTNAGVQDPVCDRCRPHRPADYVLGDPIPTLQRSAR